MSNGHIPDPRKMDSIPTDPRESKKGTTPGYEYHTSVNLNQFEAYVRKAEFASPEPRRDYRFTCTRDNIIQAAQRAAIAGFVLRVVSAGSKWVTVALTEQEASVIRQVVPIELDI